MLGFVFRNYKNVLCNNANILNKVHYISSSSSGEMNACKLYLFKILNVDNVQISKY